jgi:hypothetical protein
MLATYVNASQERLTFEEASYTFRIALSKALGADPSAETLALALGKVALETGRFGANGGLWNFNFGNIKASDKHEGLFTCIALNEVIGHSVVWFAPDGQLSRKGGSVIGKVYPVPDGHPQTRMRAYPTADDGALDYCRFVAGGRYAAAWELLLKGDAVGYVHELKAKGYFTADEATYTKGVVSLQREFIAKLEARPAPEMPVPPVDEVRELLTEQDIAAIEAEQTERYFDMLEDVRKGAHREMLNDPADEITNKVNLGRGIA